MNGELQIYGTTDDLFRAAAELIVTTARAAIESRRKFTIALAGGSTPQALYKRLATSPYREAVDWRKVEWFWGDERPVGPDDPESNYRMARAALLSRVEVDSTRIHRMHGEAEPFGAAADEYERELTGVLGAATGSPPPSLDVVLLGMGNDGHTASLFPFTTALDEQRRWVVANDVPQLNTKRLTMTYPLLNAAANVVFLVTGAGKAKVLREVLQGPHDPRKLPSQAVRPTSGRLSWLIDRPAGSQLE